MDTRQESVGTARIARESPMKMGSGTISVLTGRSRLLARLKNGTEAEKRLSRQPLHEMK
jgi:hypothetical protein